MTDAVSLEPVTPKPFPPEVTETTSSTSILPGKEAEHRRKIHWWTSVVLLFLVLIGSGAAIYVLVTTSTLGPPEAQKIAFGFIGTLLGVLWSNFAKLVDHVSKR
jgi:hypothetical protein